MNFKKSHVTKIMGVLNVTPDSFSDGGDYFSVESAVVRARKMAEEGADIIDVGGESSRPGSEPVSREEELKRVVPVVKALVKELAVPVSIDTYKPEVARRCLELGVGIVNDISGLLDPSMAKVAAEHNASVVVMHMKGAPKTMQENPAYGDVVKEIKEFFKERIEVARSCGIKNIYLDPGIGFGKTLEHNLIILKYLAEFKKLGYPLLVGPSRKSFIGALNGGLPAKNRLEGTLAAVAICSLNGADVVRVHDVREAKLAIAVADAIANA